MIVWAVTRSGDVLGVHQNGLWLRVRPGRRRLHWYSWTELAQIGLGRGASGIVLFIHLADGRQECLMLPIAGDLRQLAALVRGCSAGRCSVVL